MTTAAEGPSAGLGLARLPDLVVPPAFGAGRGATVRCNVVEELQCQGSGETPNVDLDVRDASWAPADNMANARACEPLLQRMARSRLLPVPARS